nr:TBC1 domain family member 2B-like [Ipomoea batatas]
MKTEEDAFWMLAVLLENVLVNDCYTYNLSGCHVEQRVFKDLLRKKCPRIASHLDALEFDVSLVCTEWFLCLFSKSLPSETTLRVWDVLFYEGAKVLFHVALAIFKMCEEEVLLAHQVGDVINIIQRTTHHLFDPDDLLTVAFDKIGFMMTTSISKQRKKQEPAVLAELDERSRRLHSLNGEEK